MTTLSTTLAQAATMDIERRRPGRPALTNPYLIALLRHAGEIGRTPQTARVMPRPEDLSDPQRLPPTDAPLADTISLIDGACQFGTPYRPASRFNAAPEDEPDRFLDNQVHYVAGVSLATMRGAVPVEELRTGDVVLTHSGKRQVTWVGRFDFNPSADSRLERGMPVLVQQGALGAGLPGRNLHVAPGHCIWIAGRIIPVRLLTNNLSIWQLSGTRPVCYIHVLYDKPAQGRLAATPIKAAPFWRRVVARVDFGPNLQLLADGRMISPIGKRNDRRTFIVPPRTQRINLVSLAALAVSRIEVEVNGDCTVIPADHPGLQTGWDRIEHHAAARWRTLQGIAEVPVAAQDTPARLTVYLHRPSGV